MSIEFSSEDPDAKRQKIIRLRNSAFQPGFRPPLDVCEAGFDALQELQDLLCEKGPFAAETKSCLKANQQNAFFSHFAKITFSLFKYIWLKAKSEKKDPRTVMAEKATPEEIEKLRQRLREIVESQTKNEPFSEN